MERQNFIYERIEEKKSDYVLYDFTRKENDALKTFFDLAQEFGSIEDFYLLCVAIPKSFFSLDACLYVVEPRSSALALVAATGSGGRRLFSPPPADVRPKERPYCTDKGSLVLTIRGKKELIGQIPHHIEEDVLGILEIFPVRDLDDHTRLFFEKFGNRIGFRLHNKFLVEKNLEHIRFIRSLVADIEHNIIVPNMVYKLFLRRLRAKVMKSIEIEKRLSEYAAAGAYPEDGMQEILREMSDMNFGLTGELENIEKHYRNMSLFIETLFRKSHFDQGRLVLRTKKCNMNKDVVRPQLERYLEQFRKEGISIDDRLSGVPDEQIVNVIDIGLIAQVYANLFSNALKYTREIEIFGERKKFIAYGFEYLEDHFGPGKDGLKYNVFSSGPHIPPEERGRIFEEEYRGSNVEAKPGTGHGLAFIRNAVEIHGGVAGYEAVDYGNNFYFILPK